ncbi:MAG: PEP-CTERM sorting domain-containing protein [bacterium]|nr:PEP-CTERM sorting domain-containing protein [bacterium]
MAFEFEVSPLVAPEPSTGLLLLAGLGLLSTSRRIGTLGRASSSRR